MFSAIVLHWVDKMLQLVELIHCHNAGRRYEYGGNAVYDRRTGVLHCSGFNDVELRIGFACNFPVAHISVIRAIDLADALSLKRDSLECLRRNDGSHADAVIMCKAGSSSDLPEILSALDEYIAAGRRSAERYDPNEVSKYDKAVRFESGLYVFVCITADVSSAAAILK